MDDRYGLVLVDLQEDFLAPETLTPPREPLLANVSDLLALFRQLDLPVVHVWTLVAADGQDAMPHWQTREALCCRRGAPGSRTPASCHPVPGEGVVEKRFYSAFGPSAQIRPESSDEAPNDSREKANERANGSDACVEDWLRTRGVNHLVVAGLYTHACVRTTILDAYERGFSVSLAVDAVASPEPLQSELTLMYLAKRACCLVRHEDLQRALRSGQGAEQNAGIGTAVIAPHRNPVSGHPLRRTCPSETGVIDAIVAQSRAAGQHWAVSTPSQRGAGLRRWGERLDACRCRLEDSIIREIGKPIALVREELSRAFAHLQTAIAFADCPHEIIAGTATEGRVTATARHLPVGCIGIITPWNNPVALPLGKIAAALAFGNSVVWKPAPETGEVADLLLETLAEAGLPEGLVGRIDGAGPQGEALMRHPGIDAVTLTGSIATGRVAAACCQALGKPLQAELGGNNAAIVWDGTDLEAAAAHLAETAFGFAGQRCTATRRIIVQDRLFDAFVTAFVAESQALAGITRTEPTEAGVVTDPEERAGVARNLDLRDPRTRFAPLLSAARLARIEAIVAAALSEGAICLSGGRRLATWDSGLGYAPTTLRAGPEHRIFREESFGPIAVVTPAETLSQAIALANAVPHGLLANFWGTDADDLHAFLAGARAGILRLGAAPLHPDAPFLGWQASGIGPPEHGRWDREFFARPQALNAG